MGNVIVVVLLRAANMACVGPAWAGPCQPVCLGVETQQIKSKHPFMAAPKTEGFK